MKKLYGYSVGGASRFFVELFSTSLPRNFVGEPFCAMFRKIPVAKEFMDKMEGGGGTVKSFRRKIEKFCHTALKVFIVELLCVLDFFVHRKSLCLRREYHAVL